MWALLFFCLAPFLIIDFLATFLSKQIALWNLNKADLLYDLCPLFFYVSLHFLASKILNKLSLKLTLNIISSFCPIDPVMGHWGIMMEALVIRICHCSLSSAMHTIVKMMHPVHSVMLLSQDCFCLPLLHSPSAVPWEFALERVSGLFSCSNHGRVQISKSIWTVVQWRNLRNRERPWNRSTNYSKVISAVVQPMLYKAIELSWPK